MIYIKIPYYSVLLPLLIVPPKFCPGGQIENFKCVPPRRLLALKGEFQDMESLLSI
jgi:hypothetical protein